MKKKDIFFEIIFKICVLSFVVMLIIIAGSYSKTSRMMPQLVGGVVIVLLLLSFVIDIFFKKEPKKEQAECKQTDEAKPGLAVDRRKRLNLSLLSLSISLAGICLGGIIFIVPTAFISYAFFFGDKRDFKVSIYLSLILVGMLYVAFKHVLYIPLLRGLLYEWRLF